MKKHAWLLARFSIFLVAAAFIAGHGFVLYELMSHRVLSASVVFGLIVLIVIKHLGLLGPLYALLRRGFRRSGSEDGDCPDDVH